MFSCTRTVPAVDVVEVVKVMTQAYVTTTAATAMTISNSVARIGEIPFFDLNILFKHEFTSTAKTFCLHNI